MKVYKVSPIIKYSPFFTLTYVSKEDFLAGDIVPINFNNREVLAIVEESLDLKDAKVEIRKADFQTKKIEKRIDKKKEKFLDKNLFQVLQKFSEKFLIPMGEIVYFLFGEDLDLLPSPGEGVLVAYPDDLSFKIDKKNNSEVKTKGADIFINILTNKFETIIIKDFNFDKYLNFQAPHISKLDLLFEILKDEKCVKKIILETDFLGVVEKSWLDDNIKNEKLFGTYGVEVVEKAHTAKKYLVKAGRDKNGEEEILAQEALDKISKEQKNFLFVLSHGYADRIFCNDCKKSYDCENCGHAYSILNEEEGRFLYCKNCKNKKVLQEDQYVICKHCGSWRIFPFGIGGQKVKEFLLNSLPGTEISLIDESLKKLSVKKISEEITKFLHTPGGVLIGSIRTLKVLQSLVRGAKDKFLGKTFVISTGPIVKGKYFDSDEKLLRLISQVENISKEVYINKREGDEVSLDNYKDKNKFVSEEIEFRKSAGLPPQTKVLSLIFSYKVKRHLDKFLTQDIEKLRPAGEIKKGSNYIYYWFVSLPGEGSENNLWKSLRQFGDVVLVNTIIEQSILGKVK